LNQRLVGCLTIYNFSVIIACSILKVVALASEGDNSNRKG
jgi:hypothetical protein